MNKKYFEVLYEKIKKFKKILTHPVFDHLHPQGVQALEKGRILYSPPLVLREGLGVGYKKKS
jgi:hypothetical protein